MKKLSDAEILAQIPTAHQLGTTEWRRGLRATAVRYDHSSRHLVLDLSNGYQLSVPLAALPAVGNASERQLGGVILSPEGGALRFPSLDTDFSVPGLVLHFASTVRGEAGE